MGERDAFGREIGEDTLADMGWRADLSAPAQPVKPSSVEWKAPPQSEEPPGVASGAGGPQSGHAAGPGGAGGPLGGASGAGGPQSGHAAGPGGAGGPLGGASGAAGSVAAAGGGLLGGPSAPAAPIAGGGLLGGPSAPAAPIAGAGGGPLGRGGPFAGAGRPGALPRVRPRRRRGFARLIFTLALLVVIAATGGSLVRAGKDAIDKGQNAIRGAIPSTTAPAASGSLLRPAALRKALRQLPKGQIKSLRLTAGEIDAQVVRHGKMSLVRVTAAGEATAVKTPVTIPGKAVHVDPAVPARIVRAAHRRLADVDYLVLTGLTGKATWQAHFKDGTSYSATAAGRKVRKLA